MNENLIKVLNSHLQGVIMGENEMIKLKEKVKDYRLKVLIDNTLLTIEEHKKVILNEIEELNGKAVKEEGIFGKLVEIFNSIKEMAIDNDKQILEKAIKGTEMGFKSILDLLIKESNFHDHLEKSLIKISDMYSDHIKEMQEYLITIN